MRRLSLMFFVTAALAALPAHAGEQRTLDLTAFDEAVQLYAKRFCKPSPQHGPLWRVEVSVEALADENSVVRANGAGRKVCRWHARNANAPVVRWPETFVIPVPEGDERPVPLIAFDRGVRSLLRQTPCEDFRRPSSPGGSFRGVQVRLQATVGKDGMLRANWLDAWCDWHPVTPAG